jgi:hypothetical protein
MADPTASMTDCDTKFSDGMSSRPCTPRTHSHKLPPRCYQHCAHDHACSGPALHAVIECRPRDTRPVQTAKQSCSCLCPGPAAAHDPLSPAPSAPERSRTALCTSSSEGAADICPKRCEQPPAVQEPTRHEEKLSGYRLGAQVSTALNTSPSKFTSHAPSCSKTAKHEPEHTPKPVIKTRARQHRSRKTKRERRRAFHCLFFSFSMMSVTSGSTSASDVFRSFGHCTRQLGDQHGQCSNNKVARQALSATGQGVSVAVRCEQVWQHLQDASALSDRQQRPVEHATPGPLLKHAPDFWISPHRHAWVRVRKLLV